MTVQNRPSFRIRPGMRRGHRTEVPLPTRLVSNEEFPALPQTGAQRAVEDRRRGMTPSEPGTRRPHRRGLSRAPRGERSRMLSAGG
jgi:hypothetical protein